MFDFLRKLFGARNDRSGPFLIGATGGSGTRALQGALKEAGFFMGERLNHAGDAMDFEPFLDEAINPILAETRSLDYRLADLSSGTRAAARAGFADALDAFLAERRPADRLWGWKNPRSMYVLPIVAEACPQFRFLHLVRDGRDMAISDNQNQPRKHFEALFGEPFQEGSAEIAIRLWARANGQVADWAEANLGPRYMRVRFEDLCAAPAEALARALAPAGFAPDTVARIGAAAAKVVRTPDSVGRWCSLPEAERWRLTELAAGALARFGYADA